uniref:hypothetical protein n=1 Tax=Polynucleobacter sp. TaxID=2029855 RepID=UPI0040487EEC
MNSNYLTVNYLDQNFYALFEALQEKQQWSLHTYSRLALEYYKQVAIDEGSSFSDQSFLILKDGIPVFGFIGALINNSGLINLLAYKPPCLIVEDFERSDNVINNLAWSKLNEIFLQVNGEAVIRAYLQHNFLTNITIDLMRLGGIINTHLFQFINLENDQKILWKDIRKSYRSLINRGLREMDIEYVDSHNIKKSHIDLFRKLHIEVAGKETRSVDSWELQYEWIYNNEAFLYLARMDNEIVTAGIFTYTNSVCTYFSSASRREMFDRPLFHAIIWNSILKAKALGCKWFDMNEKYFLNHPSFTTSDEKLLSISNFKMGFGGSLIPIHDISLSFKI